MEIKPTSYTRIHVKNWLHFYLMLITVPLSVATVVLHIRANPELTEIPEGYEPRDWEYYRHPVTRWMAKYQFKPMEWEFEVHLGLLEANAENRILAAAEKRVKTVMSFYNDHRSLYFEPFFADSFRIGRETTVFYEGYVRSNTNELYEEAYDPDTTIVPVEGYTK